MILRLAKLTDPYTKGSKKNCSAHILQELATENNWSFVGEIDDLLSEADNLSWSIRNRRNKLLAHRDLPTAMLKGVSKILLLEVTLDQIDKAFDAIGKAINLVYDNFNQYNTNMEFGFRL